MSECRDSPALGLIGCGAKYGGELQHCVARVSWSTFPDGRAHITAKTSTIDLCWRGGVMAEPSSIGLAPDIRGVWRRPGRDEAAS